MRKRKYPTACEGVCPSCGLTIQTTRDGEFKPHTQKARDAGVTCELKGAETKKRRDPVTSDPARAAGAVGRANRGVLIPENTPIHKMGRRI